MESRWQGNVLIVELPPGRQGFLLFGAVMWCPVCHFALMHWKWLPIDVSTIAKVETTVTTDVVVVLSLIIVRDAFEKLVVISRELRNRHKERRDVRFAAMGTWIQLMRVVWIRDTFAFPSVHPVRAHIGYVVPHPFGLDIWVPGLEAVSDVRFRCSGGHVSSTIELREGSVPMTIRCGELR